MYSPSSPVLTSFDSAFMNYQSSQCLKFKYFTTFLVCTTSLTLLSASLLTNKWIVSRPIRILKMQNRHTNLSNTESLSSTPISSDDSITQSLAPMHLIKHPSGRSISTDSPQQYTQPQITQMANIFTSASNKFQGSISFGLFSGIKILNYGLGDRISPISVISLALTKDLSSSEQILNFKLWLATLISVIIAILFGLFGSILAIINFVIKPETMLIGPVGLVVSNAVACFACLSAISCWLFEYHARLKRNILSNEEVLNGLTSENRTQFGFSYYFVITSFILFSLNIFIISVVQFRNSSKKRKARAVCEGVIMLY